MPAFPVTAPAQRFSNLTTSADNTPAFQPKPNAPDVNQRLLSLAKAVGLMVPAILLTRVKPGESEKVMANAAKELLPSDWKVWAKIGLGIASINQANKALNWNPPPWLGAFMNVSVMAGLMTGLTRTSAKTIAVLGPWLAALVQGTHYADQKLEKPLQEKYNIPPEATKITLSLLSMGAGFVGMPKLMALSEPEIAASEASKTRALSTGSCACCAGSPICLTELSNNATLAMTQVQKHFTDPEKKAAK